MSKHVDIVECVKRGMIKEVGILIGKKVDLDERDINDDCAVLCAVRRNDLGILKLLIEAGASLNVVQSNGFTPLDWAEYYENVEMCRYIVEKTSSHHV